MALPGRGVTIVGMTTSWPIPAKTGACAPRATPGAWWRQQNLSDHVFRRLPVRQWVLSVPKRLRYFMQWDGAALNMVLRIFLRVIAQTLQTRIAGCHFPLGQRD